MTTLQIQHYALYPQVGGERFATHLRANNKAALAPAILTAVLLLVTSMTLLLERPPFMSGGEAFAAFVLNVMALAWHEDENLSYLQARKPDSCDGGAY